NSPEGSPMPASSTGTTCWSSRCSWAQARACPAGATTICGGCESQTAARTGRRSSSTRAHPGRLRRRILSGLERDHLVSNKALDEHLAVFGSRGLPPAPVEPEPARRRPRTAPLVHLLG